MSTRIPPIKSQGIKSKLVPWIAEIIADIGIIPNRWVEPFMGTGVIAMNMLAKEYLLADSNPHLVDFYRAIQKNEITSRTAYRFLTSVGERLAKEGEAFYYYIQDRFNKTHAPMDFLFLNRACFNGMIRFNRHGEFNVPFCKKNERFRKAYITKICNQIENVTRFLQSAKVHLVCNDFTDILAQTNEKDFIYCDPPYIDRYTDYYNGWQEKDEIKLYNLLVHTKCPFILSTWYGNQYRKNTYIHTYIHRQFVE